MKIYTKNKDFIPEKIRYKMELREDKRQNIIIASFLILNLIIFPTTTKDIFKAKERPVQNKEESQKTPEYSNDISIWINNVFDNSIEEVHITNNTGNIIIDNFDVVDKLSINPSIRVNDINLSNDEKYKLGVSLDE